MTAAGAVPTVPAPDAPDAAGDGELDAIRERFEVEAVKAESAELDDAFSALAALLLDLRAASGNQGEFPTPSRGVIRPDAARRGREGPTPAGGEAA